MFATEYFPSLVASRVTRGRCHIEFVQWNRLESKATGGQHSYPPGLAQDYISGQRDIDDKNTFQSDTHAALTAPSNLLDIYAPRESTREAEY